MINDVSRITIMSKHCTVNRVQDMVQFDIIDKTKNEFLKGDTYSIIIVLDHNQKVPGMDFVRGRWNILDKWHESLRFNGGPVGGKHQWFIVTGIYIIFLVVISKGVLYRIIFKWVSFFRK